MGRKHKERGDQAQALSTLELIEGPQLDAVPRKPGMMLSQEYDTFVRELPELLRTSSGRFVLIRGGLVAGIYDSRDDAESAGYEQFGLESPFLVKRIQRDEPPAEFVRGADSAWHG